MEIYLEKGKTHTIYPLSSRKENQALSDFIFLDGGNLHASTWLTIRALLEQFPFDAQFLQCEDYDVLLRMEAAGVEFICCDTPATISNGDPREDGLSSTLKAFCYTSSVAVYGSGLKRMMTEDAPVLTVRFRTFPLRNPLWRMRFPNDRLRAAGYRPRFGMAQAHALALETIGNEAKHTIAS